MRRCHAGSQYRRHVDRQARVESSTPRRQATRAATQRRAGFRERGWLYRRLRGANGTEEDKAFLENVGRPSSPWAARANQCAVGLHGPTAHFAAAAGRLLVWSIFFE